MQKSDNTRYDFVAEYSILSANTWEKKTITIAPDSNIQASGGAIDNDNGEGLKLKFILLSSGRTGTNNTWNSSTPADATSNQVNLADSTDNEWYITGIQMEVGEFDSTSLPIFPFESHESNLKKCLRYCYKNTANGTNYKVFMLAQNEATTTFNSYMPFPEPMRASPSATFDGSFRIYDTGSRAISSQALSTASPYELGIQGTMASTSAGYAGKYQSNNDNDAFILLDAEL